MNTSNYEMMVNILINTLFFCLFISTFFFTYAAYAEGQIIDKQMKFLANNIKNTVAFLGENTNNKFKLATKNLNTGDMSNEDNIINNLNKKTIKKALLANIVYLIFIISVTLIIYYILDKSKSIHIKKILISNLIITIFAGICEYSFLNYFAAEIILIDPNQLKSTIIQNIIQIYKKVKNIKDN